MRERSPRHHPPGLVYATDTVPALGAGESLVLSKVEILRYRSHRPDVLREDDIFEISCNNLEVPLSYILIPEHFHDKSPDFQKKVACLVD